MKLAKIAKSGNKEAKVEDEILRRIKAALDEGKPARQVDLSEDDLELIKEMNLLTLKPTLYVTNVAEDEVATAYDENPYVQQVKEYAPKRARKSLLSRQKSSRRSPSSTKKRPRPSSKTSVRRRAVSTA